MGFWLTSGRFSVRFKARRDRAISQTGVSGDLAETQTLLAESLNLDEFNVAARSARRPSGCHKNRSWNSELKDAQRFRTPSSAAINSATGISQQQLRHRVHKWPSQAVRFAADR
jgi:hypothetical protein